MKKQLMDEMSFKKIISNQSLIIQDLDKSYNSMCSFMQLSNKYLPEAIQNFNIGQQHISKIRQNLDAIHKIMAKIKKKMNREKEEEKLNKEKEEKEKSEEEILTVTQVMKEMVDEERKENFEVGSPPFGQSMNQTEQKSEKLVQEELEKDQVQKLLAYYKLDEDQNDTKNQQPENLSPTTKQFQQAFTIIKSPEKPLQTKPIDEPLI